MNCCYPVSPKDSWLVLPYDSFSQVKRSWFYFYIFNAETSHETTGFETK